MSRDLLNRDKNKDSQSDYRARPIKDLRDPASFPPPPRANPRELAAARREETEQKQLLLKQQEEVKPPTPYRVNTSGLSTSNLPLPPGRADGADGREPGARPALRGGPGAAAKSAPALPPRLPPRSNTASSTGSGGSRQDTGGRGDGYLNQNAVRELSAAGVSVPGFGIGIGSRDNAQAQNSTSSTRNAQVGELQSRFGKLNTRSGTPPASPTSQGTSYAQKQSAVRTLGALRNDPSSVSLEDGKAAASTAHSFQQRHGAQVAAGARTAGDISQQYGVADRAGSLNQKYGVADRMAAAGVKSPVLGATGLAAKKKPPPPPPKKKPNLGQVQSQGDAEAKPPPIPIATRPQF